MSRYIKLDGIDNIKKEIFMPDDYAIGWNEAIDHIKEIPTADVEEVRHGEWIPLSCSDDDWNLLRFKCSICGREIHEHKNYDQLLKIKYPYCHCGARMNGGKG